jgi:hypothetical protein
MTDRKQFEAMLEALINEDQETAKEIFHNIVVAKSREIYEELLSEDFDLEENQDTGNPYAKQDNEEETTDEAADDEADDSEEPADDEADADDEEPADDVGGDATDDFVSDVSDEEGEEDMSDEEQVDRIMDLEDALEELKAEFEQLMAGEEGEMGADDTGAEPEMDGGMDAMGAEPAMDGDDELAKMMEYVDKVALPKHGDNGANTKSIVAGKNDMGGTTANIAKGGQSKGEGTKGGLLNPSTKEENFGNVNVPGGKGATKLSSVSKGHGAEKKGAGEQADNKKSTIGSR